MLTVACVVLRLLARLLSFSPLHPCLLKQSALLREPASFLPVLHLVLSDEGLGRTPKDVLVFTELADPGLAWRVVEVGVLLLRPALAGSICVELRSASSWLARWRRLLWGLATLGRWWTPICWWMNSIHIGTRLGTLCQHSRGVWSNWRTSAGCLGVGRRRSGRGICARGLRVRPVFLAGPNHLVG